MSKENLKKLKGKIAAIGLAAGLGASALAGCTPEDVEALQQYGIDVDVNTEDPTVEPTVEPTEDPTVEPTEEVKEEEFELTLENIIAHAPAKLEVNLAEGEEYVPRQATSDEVYAKIAELEEYVNEYYYADENEEIRNKYSYDAVRDLHVLRLLYLNTESIDDATCQEVIDTYLQEMPILNTTLSDTDFYNDFKQSKNSMFYLDEVYANEFEILEYYYDMNDKCKEQYGADYTELEENVLFDVFDNTNGYFTLDIIDDFSNSMIFNDMINTFFRKFDINIIPEELFNRLDDILINSSIKDSTRLYNMNFNYGEGFGYRTDFKDYSSSYSNQENKTK